jgi:hypothetical protein
MSVCLFALFGLCLVCAGLWGFFRACDVLADQEDR